MSLYEYRELIKNLVVSDLKVKYANSVLGFAWSLLNPLLMMLVLYFVFNGFYSMKENFVLYILTGLLAWRFFTIGTTSALGSIVGRANLITKIKIPREIIPLSSVLSSVISSLLEFSVLIPLMLILQGSIPLTALLFPVILIPFFLLVYGLGLILSSMYVYFRDLNQIWDVLMQIGFFATPIMYSLDIVGKMPKGIQFVYMLNPVTHLIGMYRDIFLSGTLPDFVTLAIILAFSIILVIAGNVIFKKLSRRFAEEV